MLPALREKPLLRRRAESARATAGTHTVSEPAADRPKAVAPASSTAKRRSQASPRPAAPREETGAFARLPSGAASARRNCRGATEVTGDGSARVETSPRGAGSGRVTAACPEVEAGTAGGSATARLVLTCDQPSLSRASCWAVVSGDSARPSVPPCGRATGGAVVGCSAGWGWVGGTSTGTGAMVESGAETTGVTALLHRIQWRPEPVHTSDRFDTARLLADTGRHSAWKRRIQVAPEPSRPAGSRCCSTRSTRNSNRCYEHHLRSRLVQYLWTDPRNSFRNWDRCRRSYRSSPQGCQAREVRLAVRFRAVPRGRLARGVRATADTAV